MLKQRKTSPFDEQLSPDDDHFLSKDFPPSPFLSLIFDLFQIMMNVVQMVVQLLKKIWFFLINQCDFLQTEMVLETVFSPVRSGVLDSYVLFKQ